jgi:transcriptional regulator with GAF, ATPase, and Fis domain
LASVVIEAPDGTSLIFPLVKRLTSLGRSAENDIALAFSGMPDSALHFELAGSELRLVGHPGTDFSLNGKRRAEGRLQQGDQIALAGAKISVNLESAPSAPKTDSGLLTHPSQVDAIRTLVRFSQRMMQQEDVQLVLEEMMDAAISLTRAEKGFLLLAEGDRMAVKVARNLPLRPGEGGSGSRALEEALTRVSDSIVAKVVATRKPLIVADALHDVEFSKSESVINFRLSSVMAAPLLDKGEVMGLLYVGNDRAAYQFDPVSLELLTVFAAQASLIVVNALLLNRLRLEGLDLRRKLEAASFGSLIGACPGMREVFRRIEKVATTDISVLIGGETGTGKEMLAQEIHRRSSRAQKPFVAINCGAIPEGLLESELFGHVRGAFTGAVATRIGRFQAASGGTLFLDEVGDMPMALQIKILRALQEHTVVKVGDSRPETIDLRVVAATHRVLEDEVKAGRFREDLYYRLNVVQLTVPPLRERGDDVLMLARYFLKHFGEELKSPGRALSKGAVEAIRRYRWPGNVRELENRIKKALVLSDRSLLTADDLELGGLSDDSVLSLSEAKTKFQREYINEILERNSGNRTKTARDLGVDARTIFRHLERLEAERTGQVLPPSELDRELDT